MQLETSVSMTSTPSELMPAPLPPAINSPITKGRPVSRKPPNITASISPDESAGTFAGMTGRNAPRMHPAMRLIVAVRAFTAAGDFGLTIDPSGRFSEIGRKQPALVGMLGSVTARIAKQAAARAPD